MGKCTCTHRLSERHVGHLHLKWTDNGGGGELKAGGQLKRQRGEVVGHRSEVRSGGLSLCHDPR